MFLVDCDKSETSEIGKLVKDCLRVGLYAFEGAPLIGLCSELGQVLVEDLLRDGLWLGQLHSSLS